MSYIKIQKIRKEDVETPEKGYIYVGYDDSTVGGSGSGLWIKDDDGNLAYYVLTGSGTGPTITNIQPADSSFVGDTITINGTNFVNGYTIVTFGGVSGTSVNVLTSGQLTVVVPNNLGSVSVAVHTPYGVSSDFSYTINYKDVKPVIVPPITPTQASIGSTIAIGGYNFVPGSTITWFNAITGETTATSSTYLTAKVPQMQTGYTIIYLETPYGNSSPPVNYFITDTNPTFLGFYPSWGNIGSTITISGTNFAIGQVQVSFGSVQASGITVHGSTYLTAKVASGTPFGATNIRVFNQTLSGFTVSGSTTGLLPAIYSILPLSASTGDVVTVTGINFDGSVTITFSSEEPTILAKTSNTLSVYLTSNIIPGINSVIATNHYGSSSAFDYTISQAGLGPVITSFNPTSNYRGRSVNLNGSNFKVGSGNLVYYGNVAAFVSSDATTSLVKTQISNSSPTGIVDVKLVNSAGSYTKSGFIINTSGGTTPYITSISPVYAKAGDLVTVYGTGLTDSVISFGNSYPGLSTVTTYVSDTQLLTYVPSGLVGIGQNKMVNVYATGTYETYKYTPFEVYSTSTDYPSILSFTPISGPEGTLVTISGTSFTKYYTDASIYAGGSYYMLDSQSYISDTEVRGYIPNTYGNYGASTIKIETPVGTDQKAVFTIEVPITTTTTTAAPTTTTTAAPTTTTTAAPTTTTTTTAAPTTTTTTTAAPTTTTTAAPTTTTTTSLFYYQCEIYDCPACGASPVYEMTSLIGTYSPSDYYYISDTESPYFGKVIRMVTSGGAGGHGAIPELLTGPAASCAAACIL